MYDIMVILHYYRANMANHIDNNSNYNNRINTNCNTNSNTSTTTTTTTANSSNDCYTYTYNDHNQYDDNRTINEGLSRPGPRLGLDLREHNSTRKSEYVRIMLPLMSQIWFHILGWGKHYARVPSFESTVAKS